MSDKQITREQELIYRIVEQWGNVINMPKMEQWLKDYAASQPPAVKGAVWVKIGPTTDPSKTGVYKVRAYDTLHNDGAYLYGSCAYNNEVEEWNANWDEWLDESPTAADVPAEQDFIDFVKLERNNISNEMLSDSWWLEIPAAKRVVFENILIAYDQMVSRLTPTAAVKGAEDIGPTSENMTTGLLWAKYVDVKDANGNNALSREGFINAVAELRHGAVWVKASKYKTDKAVYRPYRVKCLEDEGEFDYGEIYVTEDEGTIFLDVDNEWSYEPQSNEKWKDYEILDESPTDAREDIPLYAAKETIKRLEFVIKCKEDEKAAAWSWAHNALKYAKETIDFAHDELHCPEPMVETWANLYMNSMATIQQAQEESQEKTAAGELPADVIDKILRARDALIAKDIDEAYHQLYAIASPRFDKFKPWAEMEARAAAAGDGKERKFQEFIRNNPPDTKGEWLDQSTNNVQSLQIDRTWIWEALIDFTVKYREAKNKDIANDAAEYLDNRLKGMGIHYVLDEDEQATAAGDGKEEKAFAEWLVDNTQIIREEKITLYRYCDKMNEWGNYTLDDIYTEYKNL